MCHHDDFVDSNRKTINHCVGNKNYMVLANTVENFGDYIDSTVPYNHNIIARIKVKVKTVVNQNSETNLKMWSFSASVIGEHMVGLGQSIL